MLKTHLMRIAVYSLLLAFSIGVQAQETPTATPYPTLEPTGESPVDSPYAGRSDLPAPEFPPDLEWLNVDAPLTIRGLRGKIVLLDFWTYGCINCIHMIPVIRQLEEKYGDSLVIIGVHSAKFDNEGETANLRQIVQRYELAHPVINDEDFLTWSAFRVNAWPTFAVIDPRGNVLAMQAGEIPFEAFDRLIAGMVEYFDSTGELSAEPLELALENAGVPRGALAFPGKVLADAEGRRLFIADTNHHRIVVTNLDTDTVETVIGAGTRGLTDGDIASAQFNKPQGMALRGNILYIADTENHAIRAVDLASGTVTTVAGTGTQSYERHFVEEGILGDALSVPIASPWDVALGTGDDAATLYIAMAGPHQLWAMDVETNTLRVLAGSAREGLEPGTFAEAQLAQPSGVFYREGLVYFADSESSSLRVADTNVIGGEVRTLAGPDTNDLFDFGDRDGTVGVSRLQHPLGVTGGSEGLVYVADTYNSRIKAYEPATGEITTLFGLGSMGGYVDGNAAVAEFDEPGGIAFADSTLYVADTNNHAIRRIDLVMGTVETITFGNVEALQIADETTVIGGNRAGETLILPTQTVGEGNGAIVLRLILPEGYKINAGAPSQVEWNTAGSAIDIAEASRIISLRPAADAPLTTIVETRLPVDLDAGDDNDAREDADTLYGLLTLYYCAAETETLCYLDRVAIELPVIVTQDDVGGDIIIERAVSLPSL